MTPAPTDFADRFFRTPASRPIPTGAALAEAFARTARPAARRPGRDRSGRTAARRPAQGRPATRRAA